MQLIKQLFQIGAQIEQCEHKVRFHNAREAYKFSDKRGLRQRAYACPICGYWHLTSQMEAKANG